MNYIVLFIDRRIRIRTLIVTLFFVIFSLGHQYLLTIKKYDYEEYFINAIACCTFAYLMLNYRRK